VSALVYAADQAADKDVGPGGLGFLVVVVLIVVLVGLLLAMRRSMKSLRRHVDDGSFDATAQREFEERESRSAARKPASQSHRDGADA
jgi:uncharacterized membrane protein